MTGFRFVQSGSRTKGAANRAIGKRMLKGHKIPFVPPPPPCFNAQSPSPPTSQEDLPPPAFKPPSDPPPPRDPAPLRPVSEIAEMWEDYHIFKAACLLPEWRRKWAAYLPKPA